ncbi:hypothetical protein [Flammeovirga kamogawensis]|uniref:Uncharacterized protein n=1 Tax=Flammeovirga kamogawensis TaxID=373891 RepID=A0ABX8GUG9_9BACT|nr:hypothetical protein [Flammeovirga kamogawensis]MBB6459694.1 hypothetical protein [Flammeovirga kamogawensis]QWG07245.1 hypothetical protein KM029_18370 [Flammeovirga kamogawensis]
MKTKISRRDIIFIFIGAFSMLCIEVALDWDQHQAAFKKGYEAGRNSIEKIQ